MLTLWRRHHPKHCKLQGRDERKCRCPIWISGVDEAGSQVKETTKLRDWTRAESLLRRWETGTQPAETSRTTIEDWQIAFLSDAANPAGKNLKPQTIEKYKQLFKPLSAFAVDNGYRYVNQLDLDALTALRATWKDAPLSASKKLKRLRGVLKFALRRRWILENAALDLDMPKIRPKPPSEPRNSPGTRSVLVQHCPDWCKIGACGALERRQNERRSLANTRR
jgi:integrase/recombinase XerD